MEVVLPLVSAVLGFLSVPVATDARRLSPDELGVLPAGVKVGRDGGRGAVGSTVPGGGNRHTGDNDV